MSEQGRWELPEQGERERDDEYWVRVLDEGLAWARAQGLSRKELRELQRRQVWRLASLLVGEALRRDAMLRSVMRDASVPLDDVTGERVLQMLYEPPIVPKRGGREAMRAGRLVNAMVVRMFDAFIGRDEFYRDLGSLHAAERGPSQATGDGRRATTTRTRLGACHERTR